MYVLASLVLIGFGLLTIIFPDFARGLDRFSNQLEGVQTRQRGTYEVGRIIRGALIVVAGILVLLLPRID